MEFPIKIKAVVIDLDGTLLDTAPDLAHAAELMMAELNLPAVPLDTIKTYIGNGVSRLAKRVLTGSMDAEPDAMDQQDRQAGREGSFHFPLCST